MTTSILLALGGAECVWSDMAAAKEILGCRSYDVAAVNDTVAQYSGPLAFMATLHPEKVEGWLRLPNFPVVCHKGAQGYQPDHIVQELWSGSSGLYVVQVAVRLFGYRKVICCGIPLEEDAGHIIRRAPWAAAKNYRRGWREASSDPTMRGRFRSMSGWTSELLGKPDEQWLDAPV